MVHGSLYIPTTALYTHPTSLMQAFLSEFSQDMTNYSKEKKNVLSIILFSESEGKNLKQKVSYLQGFY